MNTYVMTITHTHTHPANVQKAIYKLIYDIVNHGTINACQQCAIHCHQIRTPASRRKCVDAEKTNGHFPTNLNSNKLKIDRL